MDAVAFAAVDDSAVRRAACSRVAVAPRSDENM
eukprot:COSAG02_NODE_36068_length_459_cov_1.338889_1_plen_32_part_01